MAWDDLEKLQVKNTDDNLNGLSDIQDKSEPDEKQHKPLNFSNDYEVYEDEKGVKYRVIPEDDLKTLLDKVNRYEGLKSKQLANDVLLKELVELQKKVENIKLDDTQLDELIQQKLAPIVEQQVDVEIERETQKFINNHPEIFSTLPKEEAAKIMDNIYLTAAKYQDDKGNPIDFETAFNIAFGDRFRETLKNIVIEQASKPKPWGTEENTAVGKVEKRITSRKDVDEAFDEAFRRLRGM